MIDRLICGIVFLALASFGTFADAQVLPTPEQFAALNVQGRRDLMRSVEVISQESVDPTIVSLVEAGLQDAEESIRRDAAFALNHVFRDSSGRTRTELSVPRASRTLESVLLRGLDDRVMAVRAASADALIALPPRLGAGRRARLVSMYSSEKESLVRSVLVTGLGASAPDAADVQQLVVTALDDDSETVRRSAARAVAKSKPAAALPRLVAYLASASTTPDDAAINDSFVDALISYGRQAEPHLSVLERLMKAEVSPARQARLREAIDKVRKSPRQ